MRALPFGGANLMPDRAHLTTLRFASALRQACLEEPYGRRRLLRDLPAGITVGIIAIPLSMALAVASGVAPQYGLYTAMIAGLIIPLTGGSRFSISGPTAAFVVILQPVTQQFGLGGLLLASFMAGLMLIGMALARLGRLIEYIPESVTLGFTGGIAIVIATLQVKDFFGLPLQELPEFWPRKIEALASALPSLHWPELLVGLVTLAVMLLWKRLNVTLTGHLPAVVAGVATALLLGHYGHEVASIGSRFDFTLPDGTRGQGIPPVFPHFQLPWSWQTPSGESLLSLATLRELLPAAFSIAMLGAIESLLCAVVLDGMTGRRHNANGELLGQGLGNVVVPFFGGFAATAAIARSAANYRAGAASPMSGVIHAFVVMAAILFLAKWLSFLPMASMAALLLMVAWNMSEAPKIVALVKKAPREDILVLATCLSLTVLFDMVIAIAVGIVLASLLFMKQLAAMTKVVDVTGHPKLVDRALPEGWRILKINGPLFFAAAERVFAELRREAEDMRGVILYMDGVSLLDAGGLSAFLKFVEDMNAVGTKVVVADLQFQPLRTLARATVEPVPGQLRFTATLAEAVDAVDEFDRNAGGVP